MTGVASFDPSLSTGVAWGAPEKGAPMTALYELPPGKAAQGRAFSILRGAALALVQAHKIVHIVVEAPMLQITRKHSAYSLQLQVSLTAILAEVAHTSGCTYAEVAVQSWRKTFIGRGDLPGEESKDMACKRCTQLGWLYRNDHNVAEASGLWFHEMANRFPRWRPTRWAA